MNKLATLSNNIDRLRSLSYALVIALFASLIAIGSPVGLDGAQGAYTSHVNYTADSAITFNNNVCDLGNPAQHLTALTAFPISTSAQLWEVTDCVSSSAPVYFELKRNIDVAGSLYAPTSSPIGYSSSPSANANFTGVFDGKNFAISNVAISTSQDLALSLGLFAAADNATFLNLALSGVINYSGATWDVKTGGLVGSVTNGITLSNVVSSANVTGFEKVGGLIGSAGSGDVSITSCRTSGALTAERYGGGILGRADNGVNVSLVSTSNLGVITAQEQSGGLVGQALERTVISSSTNSGAIFGTSYLGGLVGDANSVWISGSANTGDINASYSLGGLVASGVAIEILNSSNYASIIGSNVLVGGLVGQVSNLTMRQSRNEGEVAGSQTVGGLVAITLDASTIYASYNSGAISSGGVAGGLAAISSRHLQVSNSYNVATVSGTSEAGGLVGNASRFASFAFSYNAGTVTGTSNADAILGKAPTYTVGSPPNRRTVASTISASAVFTTVASSYSSTSTIAALQQASGFVGFDFNTIWAFGTCSENFGLPRLRHFGQSANFNSAGCVIAAPTGGSATAPAPYNGPILTQPITPALVGTNVVLDGKRLGGVVSLKIGDVAQAITSLSDNAIGFTVDSKTVLGINDIVLEDGSYGKLTVISAILIMVPIVYVNSESPVVEAPSSLIGTTRVVSRDLAIRNGWFERNVKDTGIYNVVCTAAVAPGTTMHRKIQAKKLAIETCANARSYLGGALRVQAKETDLEFLHGRVLITFNG
jgi:hypothetical protein